MDEFKDELDFSDLQVLSSTKLKPSLGHHNEKSPAVKGVHKNSPNREDSLNNNNNVTMWNTNRTLGFAQNGSCGQVNVMDLHSSHLCQAHIFLDENQNESRNVDDPSNTNSSRSNRNLFYKAQGRFGEPYDQSNRLENSSSTDRQSDRQTERVHKSSIERQDSITLDIGLGDCAQTENTLFGERVSIADTHDLLARLDTTKVSFKHPIEGAQDETCPDKYQYLHVLHKLFQSHILSFNEVPDTSSTYKQIRENTQSFPGRSGPCDDETEDSKSGRDILLLCRDCSHSLTYDLGKARSSQNVDGLSNEGSKTWGWHSVNKKDVAMFVLIGLLAFGVFHLHGRVEAVERGLGLSFARGCSCVKHAETSDSGATNSGLHADPDDVVTQTLPDLVNDQQESITTNDATHSNVLTNYFNNKNREKLRETNFSSNEQRLNIPPTISHNLLETTETVREMSLAIMKSQRTDVFKNTLSISGLGEETVVKHGHRYPHNDNVRFGGRLRSPRDTRRRAYSRNTRSANREWDPKTIKEISNGGDDEQKELKSNSEVYEARFYELFPFRNNFLEKECTGHPLWNKGIVGCRNRTIKLQPKYSILPIYTANYETASKARNQRLVMINDSPGEFVVNIPGDYLVQLNIAIALENYNHSPHNNHFLAIYLNGQATLACHHGGFRCPHTNRDGFHKYKICNIIGMLHLNTNDILDIRTMEENMAVAMDSLKSTFFRVLLLNKSV